MRLRLRLGLRGEPKKVKCTPCSRRPRIRLYSLSFAAHIGEMSVPVSYSSNRVMAAAETRTPEPAAFSFAELEQAIGMSQSYLLGQQKPEGYWIGELMVDCTLVADVVAFRHWNGKVDAEWQRKAVNHIFSLQMAVRRLEHLLRRAGGGQRHHQGVPGPQAGRRARHRPPHVAGAPNGPEPGRGAALEHVLQIVPRPARPVSLGLRAHHPLRNYPDRQMVLRQFQRDKFLEPLHARAPFHHQPFQAHPSAAQPCHAE